MEDSIITAEYNEIRSRMAKLETWTHGRRSYPTTDIPVDARVSNDERSAVEVYDFILHPPVKYFLYIKVLNVWQGTANTWTGDYLGNVGFGRSYRSIFGDTRVPITLLAVNGKRYYGTYYKSAGDHARITMAKECQV